MKRIGPTMAKAIRYVAVTPGCTKREAANYCTPNPHPPTNEALGYEPVNRAIQAGEIFAVWRGNKYALYSCHEYRAIRNESGAIFDAIRLRDEK